MLLVQHSQYKSFLYLGETIELNPNSIKKLLFRCHCGNEKLIALRHITADLTKTCGQCNCVTLVNSSKVGNFTYVGNEIRIHRGTTKKLPFRCDCGNIKNMYVFSIFNGHAKTCGDCNLISLSTGDVFGNLTYVGNTSYTKITKHSKEKEPFYCSCGTTKIITLRNVLAGEQKTCGHCQEIFLTTNTYYKNFKYVGVDTYTYPWSKDELLFQCRCGNIRYVTFSSITAGDIVSCGSCYHKVYNWYKDNERYLKSLNSPVTPVDLPLGGPSLLETSDPISNLSKGKCPSCSREYLVRFTDIKRGRSLTCGCVINKVSVPNIEIKDFIESLGLNCTLEFDLSGRKYDVAVPSKKLVIEHNGIAWHSKLTSKKVDLVKYNLVLSHGFDEIMIYEDEWKKKREIIKNIIRQRLGYRQVQYRIRSSKCEVKLVTSAEVSDLYDTYHYIGSCNSSYNFGIFYEGILIGAISFRKPSRQNIPYDYEVSRMVMIPSYSVYGVWSSVLKGFIKLVKPRSIVTYSDNRLFTGKVYEKMGFVYDGDIEQDYYWSKGSKRYHKSGLRKPNGSTFTESELRESEGYSKIWDLGKKRWVLKC